MPSVITLSDAFGTSGLGGPTIFGGGNALGIPIYNAGTGLTGHYGADGEILAGPAPLGAAAKGLLIVGTLGAIGVLAYLGARDRPVKRRLKPLKRRLQSRAGVTIYE